MFENNGAQEVNSAAQIIQSSEDERSNQKHGNAR